MLLRLAHLGMVNAFVMLRLRPMSDRDKAMEILVLRRRLSVLERRLGMGKVRFSPGGRAFPAALPCRLPRGVLCMLRLLVRPDTVLCWHRGRVARRHAAESRPKRPGRPHAVLRPRLGAGSGTGEHLRGAAGASTASCWCRA